MVVEQVRQHRAVQHDAIVAEGLPQGCDQRHLLPERAQLLDERLLRQTPATARRASSGRTSPPRNPCVEELRAFREQVALIAPLWTPYRDDGVVLNCAVLWRLFDHHRAWQKECKKKWGELARGKYDWAGWAMHLWPERVVAACAADRSIAIAHGLEEALWEEDEDGSGCRAPTRRSRSPSSSAERRSPAIQAALDEFERAG